MEKIKFLNSVILIYINYEIKKIVILKFSEIVLSHSNSDLPIYDHSFLWIYMYVCCYIIYVFQICMEMRFYKLKTSFHKLQTKMLILKLGQALFFRSWIHHYITTCHIPRMICKSNNSQADKLSSVMASLAKSRSVLGVCSWCRVSPACGVWNVTLISLSDRATSDPPSSD